MHAIHCVCIHYPATITNFRPRDPAKLSPWIEADTTTADTTNAFVFSRCLDTRLVTSAASRRRDDALYLQVCGGGSSRSRTLACQSSSRETLRLSWGRKQQQRMPYLEKSIWSMHAGAASLWLRSVLGHTIVRGSLHTTVYKIVYSTLQMQA